MADYYSIGEKFGIIYTCNCGWLDRGHSFTGSSRPLVGAPHLWKAIVDENGLSDIWNRRQAYVVSYRQDAVKKMLGMKFYPGITNHYVIRRGLANVVKQQVALGIFMDVSRAFEQLQDSWLARHLTGSDSGFSEEDLVSDLISFYKTLFSKLDVETLCKPEMIEKDPYITTHDGWPPCSQPHS